MPAEVVSDENFLNSFVQDEVEVKEPEKDEEDVQEGEEAPPEQKEEEEEEDTSNIKPLMASIKEKYPEIFKDFPELKDSFFRSRAFSTVFATPEEAKEAFSDNEAYLSLRESALSGDPAPLINSLNGTDKEAFTSFSRKFLPSLYKLDQELYGETTLPILQGTLRHVFDEGKRAGNEDLQTAAKIVAEALGLNGAEDGSRNYVKPIKEIKEDPQEVSRAFQDATNVVAKEVSESLTKEIRRGLDPDGVLTPFIRKTVISETIEGINKQLIHDQSFMNAQAARWIRAKREGFDDESSRKIINAYLSRAKSLMPNVRRKVLEQAIGENQRSTDSRVQRIREKTPDRKEVVSGRDSRNGKGKPDASRIDWNKTSDMDLLNGNVTYKS